MDNNSSKVGRFELKAIMPAQQGILFARSLLPFFQKDHANLGGGYNVHSLYYDDVARSQYEAKKEGLNKKEKHRLRFYENGKNITAEAKIKEGRMNYKLKKTLNTSSHEKFGLANREIIESKNMPSSLNTSSWQQQSPVVLI
ncbi:MAG: VTC domain-containing protein, partial [Planctomycetes bacterium]|nr:VTC domain-containing protein [Planctomycetota bacterium]